MFGHESKPSKIYRYGCLPPTAGLAEFETQVSAMHKYRNALCALEHERRDRVNAVFSAAAPGVAAVEEAVHQAEAELAAVNEKVAAERVERQTKKAGPVADARAALIATLKLNRAKLKELRQAVRQRTDVAERLRVIAADTASRQKELRHTSGLYWGNYLAVEQSSADMQQGPPPVFHRWQGGEGRIAVQIQKGISPAELGGDNRVRLILNGLHGRGNRPYGDFWLRVASNPDRSPVWCVVPVVYHRPLPPDCQVKWVYLHRRRTGTRWRWELSVVVSREEWPVEGAADAGRVAVRIGYTMTPVGLRVAEWAGDDGAEGELVIPAADLRRWEEPMARRSVRDQTFNATRDSLADWAKGTADLPDWFRERTKTLPQWRSAARLASFVGSWRGSRIAGDDEIFTAVDAWERADRREYNSEAGQRARAVRWRDNLYRNFVAGLRAKYKMTVLRDVDWKAVQEAVADRRFSPLDPVAVAWPNIFPLLRTIAAPGRLAALVKEGFAAVELRECEGDERKAGARSRAGRAGSVGGSDAAGRTDRPNGRRERPPLAKRARKEPATAG